jgi:hypothetical protein
MGNRQACIEKSHGVLRELTTSNYDRMSNIALEIPPHTGSFAFRCTLTNEILTTTGQKVKSISISIPPDAMGNRGPEEPYREPIVPGTIETALFGADDQMLYADELGYENVQRFFSVRELIEHFESFADGRLRLRS